jgi:hypothetical protein
MSKELKIKIMRETSDERLVDLEGLMVEEVLYEKKQEHTEPTSSILFAPASKLARTYLNIDELDPYMTHVQFAWTAYIDSNPSKKNKGTNT